MRIVGLSVLVLWSSVLWAQSQQSWRDSLAVLSRAVSLHPESAG